MKVKNVQYNVKECNHYVKLKTVHRGFREIK